MSNKQTMTYEVKIKAELQDLLTKTEELKKNLSGIEVGKGVNLDRTFRQIETSLDKLAQKTSAPIPMSAFDGLVHETEMVKGQIESLSDQIEHLAQLSDQEKIELLPKSTQKRIAESKKALETFEGAMADAKKSTKEFENAQKDLAAQQKEVAKLESDVGAKKAMLDSAKQQYEASKKEQEALVAKTAALKSYIDARKKAAKGDDSELASAKKSAQDAGFSGADLDSSDVDSLTVSYKNLKAEQEQSEKMMKRLGNTYATVNGDYLRLNNILTAQREILVKLTNSFTSLEKAQKDGDPAKIQTAYANLRKEAEKLGLSLEGIGEDYSVEGLEKLKQTLASCEKDGLNSFNSAIEKGRSQLYNYSTAAEEATNKTKEFRQESALNEEKIAKTRALTDKIKQFVGLQGAAIVARKAVSSAIDTIKQLDETMTEMSVVTNLTVGDYWKQLPQYSKQASELGVSINDAYKAATLYYQQGLRSNEVTKISAETLKLAKIANLEAEDATNKMTAALRGFNMELNETSAQRVADVYSELAAITAADVGEISNAMTKTASIAHSAGMEFETTAAFLSQIIETTRESAETAGTAMKTIIARFQELKKSPDEIGEIDGEIVDANKIETALRSVGVALRDSSGQFRDLDDVFMELSEKWDGLDTNTQRYIATIAAGSRQQSRFIAMMSDYSRTQDLVSAANSSAGASNEQFEKTLDSLEAKLQKLKNAWDTFTMDLLNSEVLKTAVDLLTEILETINEVTEKIGGENSGAIKIGLIVASLGMADKALTIFKNSLGEGNTVAASFGSIWTTTIDGIRTRLEGMKKTIDDVYASAQEGAARPRGQKGDKTKKKKSESSKSEQAAKATEKYTAALEKQKSALKETNKEQDKLNKTQSTSDAKEITAEVTEQSSAINNANKLQVEGEREKALAEAEYAAIRNISIAQSKDVLAMSQAEYVQDLIKSEQTKGLSAETVAYHASLAGLTSQKMAEYKATMIANGVSDEEIRNRMQQITLTYSQAGATMVENAEKKTSNKLSLTSISNSIKGAAAKVAETVAQWAQNAALATGISLTFIYAAAVIIIIGLIVLLVVAVSSLVKAFETMKKRSPEAQLDRAKKAAEAASEAADKAAESFNKLNDAFDSLSDKYSNLEELTKGTREWQQAVNDINSEVADLIAQYPELASLVTTDDGVLTIDLESDEALQVLNDYNKRMYLAKAGELYSKINVIEKQQAVDAKETRNNKDYSHLYSEALQASGVKNNQEAFVRDFSKALVEGAIARNGVGQLEIINNSRLNELGLDPEQVKKFNDSIGDGIDTLRDYGRTLTSQKTQTEALSAAIQTQIVAMIDLTNYTEEEASQIQNYSTGSRVEYLKDVNAREYKEEYSNKNNKAKYIADIIEAQTGERQEITIIENGGGTSDDTYKVGEDGEELSVSDLLEQYGLETAVDTISESLKKLPDAIDKVSSQLGKGAGEAYEKIMAAGSGTKMSNAELQELIASGLHDEAKVDEIWNSLVESGLDEAFGDKSYFINYYSELAREAWQVSQENIAKEVKLGLQASNDISLEAEKEYLNKLNSVYLEKGTEGAQQFNKQIQLITKDLNNADLETFYSQLLALDWDDADSWDNFTETIKALGVNLPEESLENFVDMAKEANNAIKDFSLDKLVEEVKKVGSVVKEIVNGEKNREFSDDEYQALIDTVPELADKFIQNIDGSFTYIGESFDTLSDEIKESLESWLEEGYNTIQQKTLVAGIQSEISDKDDSKDIKKYEKWSTEEQKEYIKQVLSVMQAQGVDIDSLGVRGLGSETTADIIDLMSDSELTTVLGDLCEIGTDSKYWFNQGTTTLKQTNGLLAQMNTLDENIGLAKVVRDSFNNIEGIEQRRAGSDEYQQALSNWTEAIESGNEEQAQFWKKVVDQLNAQFNQDFKDEKDTAKNSILGYIKAIYSQAVQAGVPEEALSGYSTIYEMLEKIDPLSDTFPELLGYLNTYEAGVLDLTKATEEAEEALEAFRASINVFDIFDSAKEGNDFKQEQLDKDYERKEKQGTLTLKDVADYVNGSYEVIGENLSILMAEQKSWATAIEGLMSPNNPFSKYVMGFDLQTGSYAIDYNAAQNDINSIENEEERQNFIDAFNSYLSTFDDFSSSYRNNINEIGDSLDSLIELQEFGKEAYDELVDRLVDAIKKTGEKQIEKLNNLNDTITETQQEVISGIQAQISQQRQQESNRETEEEIALKRSQLAYLQSNSADVNAMEILQLQKDIADMEQEYQQTLVDQTIQSMQDANDRAERQRERQIYLAEQQLEAYVNSQDIYIHAEAMLLEGLANQNGFENSNANELLLASKEYYSLAASEQTLLRSEIQGLAAAAGQYAWNNEKWKDFFDTYGDHLKIPEIGVAGLTQSLTTLNNLIAGDEKNGVAGLTGVTNTSSEAIKAFGGDIEELAAKFGDTVVDGEVVNSGIITLFDTLDDSLGTFGLSLSDFSLEDFEGEFTNFSLSDFNNTLQGIAYQAMGYTQREDGSWEYGGGMTLFAKDLAKGLGLWKEGDDNITLINSVSAMEGSLTTIANNFADGLEFDDLNVEYYFPQTVLDSFDTLNTTLEMLAAVLKEVSWVGKTAVGQEYIAKMASVANNQLYTPDQVANMQNNSLNVIYQEYLTERQKAYDQLYEEFNADGVISEYEQALLDKLNVINPTDFSNAVLAKLNPDLVKTKVEITAKDLKAAFKPILEGNSELLKYLKQNNIAEWAAIEDGQVTLDDAQKLLEYLRNNSDIAGMDGGALLKALETYVTGMQGIETLIENNKPYLTDQQDEQLDEKWDSLKNLSYDKPLGVVIIDEPVTINPPDDTLNTTDCCTKVPTENKKCCPEQAKMNKVADVCCNNGNVENLTKELNDSQYNILKVSEDDYQKKKDTKYIDYGQRTNAGEVVYETPEAVRRQFMVAEFERLGGDSDALNKLTDLGFFSYFEDKEWLAEESKKENASNALKAMQVLVEKNTSSLISSDRSLIADHLLESPEAAKFYGNKNWEEHGYTSNPEEGKLSNDLYHAYFGKDTEDSWSERFSDRVDFVVAHEAITSQMNGPEKASAEGSVDAWDKKNSEIRGELLYHMLIGLGQDEAKTLIQPGVYYDYSKGEDSLQIWGEELQNLYTSLNENSQKTLATLTKNYEELRFADWYYLSKNSEQYAIDSPNKDYLWNLAISGEGIGNNGNKISLDDFGQAYLLTMLTYSDKDFLDYMTKAMTGSSSTLEDLGVTIRYDANAYSVDYNDFLDKQDNDEADYLSVDYASSNTALSTSDSGEDETAALLEVTDSLEDTGSAIALAAEYTGGAVGVDYDPLTGTGTMASPVTRKILPKKLLQAPISSLSGYNDNHLVLYDNGSDLGGSSTKKKGSSSTNQKNAIEELPVFGDDYMEANVNQPTEIPVSEGPAVVTIEPIKSEDDDYAEIYNNLISENAEDRMNGVSQAVGKALETILFSSALKALGLAAPLALIIGALGSVVTNGTLLGGLVQTILKMTDIPLSALQDSLGTLIGRVGADSFLGKILKIVSDILLDVRRFLQGDKKLDIGDRTGEERVAVHQELENARNAGNKTQIDVVEATLRNLINRGVNLNNLGISGFTGIDSVAELEDWLKQKDGESSNDYATRISDLYQYLDNIQVREEDYTKDKNAAQQTFDSIAELVLDEIITPLGTAFETFKNKVISAGDTIKTKIENAAQEVVNKFNTAASTVTNAVTGAWSDIVEFFSGLGLKKNAKGSITHYTGPMWIDGTPSRPEMVLNADQTQDMLAVVSMLNSSQGEGLANNFAPLKRLGNSIPKLPQYKTGGKVKKTGLAWLDGTSDRPEYVLNAQQTQDYLELQKLLSNKQNKYLTRPSHTPTNQENHSLGSLVDVLSGESAEKEFQQEMEQLFNTIKNRLGDRAPQSEDSLGNVEILPDLLDNGLTFEIFDFKDILGSFLKQHDNNFVGQNGDNYFEIDIHVDKLESDYDVDQLVDKIRRTLYEDASYRNVSSLGLMR